MFLLNSMSVIGNYRKKRKNW